MRQIIKITIKTLFFAVFVLFTASLTLLAGACGNKKVNIHGFEVSEKESIKQGGVFSIVEPIVKDDDGNLYEVTSLVYNSLKEKTEVIGGKFSANDENGYTIKYSVTVNGEKIVKYTAVEVIKSKGPVFSLGEFETRCESGETLALPDVYSETTGAEFTYEICRYDQAAEIIEKGKYESGKRFLLADGGVYSVTIIGKLNGEEKSVSYLVRAIDAKEKGLVQKASESDFQKVNPEKEGIGAYSSFVGEVAKSVSTDWYVPYYFKPAMDKEYYAKMASEGFDAVTLWLYLDSNNAHKVYKQYTNGGYSTEDDLNDEEFPAINLQPKRWTAFHINLEDTRKDFRKSFLTAFERIYSQEFPLFWLDNYGSTCESTITLYIGDIYVTKTRTPVLPEYGTVEIGSVKDLPTDELNTEYFLSDDDGVTREAGAIDFSTSGKYVLTARYTTGCYFGEKSVVVNVEPTHSFAFEKTVWNRDKSQKISPAELIPKLTDKSGATVAVNSFEYSVYRDDLKVSDENGAFTADESGIYKIKTYVSYEKNGKTLTDRFVGYLDAFDGDTKYLFFSPKAERTAGSKRYNWDRNVSVSDETTEIGGRTGNFVKLSSKGEDIRAVVKPLYTKSYYQALVVENPELKIILPYYVKTAESYTHAQAFALNETSLAKETANVWKYREIGLKEYLDSYFDTCYELYESAPKRNGGTIGFIDVFTEAKNTELYLPEIRLYETATGEVAADNVTINRTIAVKDAFAVTIGGENADILSLTIEYEGKTYAVGNTMTLAFGGDYTFIISACAKNKFSEIRYSGHYEDGLELKKGQAIYAIREGVKVSDIPDLGGGYSVEYLLIDNTGKEVESAIEVRGNTVYVEKFNGFGNYTFRAYAAIDSATVGRKLFYEAEIDYCESMYVYNSLNGQSGRKDVVLWDYYWGGHTGSKIHVGVHEVGGKSVDSIRATTNFQLFNVQFKPQYGKEYYKRIADEGATFTFGFYITGVSDGSPIAKLPVQLFGSSVQTNTSFDTWHTAVIPASDIVEYYDYLIGSPSKTSDVAKCSLIGVQNDIFADITIYLTMPEFIFEPETASAELENEKDLTVNTEIDLSKLSVRVNGIALQPASYSLQIEENATIEYSNGILVATAETTVKIKIKVDYVTENGKIYRTVINKSLRIAGNEEIYDGIAPDPYDSV